MESPATDSVKLLVSKPEVDHLYGSVEEVSNREQQSIDSYSEYHKVCDMRKVFDANPKGIAAIALTFLLVFTGWCAWHETVEWVGTMYDFKGEQLVRFAAIVNGCAVGVLAVLLVLMRYMVGPILSYHWRSLFAVLIVLTAIAVWECLEAFIDMLIGTQADQRGIFYLIACGVACVLTFIFERVFHYDVIGNHLLTPP